MTRLRPAPRTGSTRDWRSILFQLLTVASIATAIAGAYNFVLLPLLGSFTGPFEDFSAYAQAAHSVAGGTSPYAFFDGRSIVMAGGAVAELGLDHLGVQVIQGGEDQGLVLGCQRAVENVLVEDHHERLLEELAGQVGERHRLEVHVLVED